MNIFERIEATTQADFEDHIRGSKLLEMLGSGRATRDQYVVYLREMHFLVRHTSRALALAASRLEDGRRGLRSWLLDQAKDEHGHEQFCFKDIKQLGLDPARVTDAFPGPGAWSFVTQNYYMAGYGEPAALMGVASATEVMGARLAGPTADSLVSVLGIPAAATSFLRSHAGFDKRHLQEVTTAINTFCDSEALFNQIVFSRRMSFRALGLLFGEVASSKERFFRDGNGAAHAA